MDRLFAMDLTRRTFVAAATFAATAPAWARSRDPLYRISLAEWSLNKQIKAGELDHLDFAKTARELDIDAIEYVNSLFGEKPSGAYVEEMKRRADDHGVKSMLIMCDAEGEIGDPDDAERRRAVRNHHKWADAAHALECHSIRVNAASKGSYEEQQKLAADGLRQLVEYAAPLGLNVIVENHGGLSSNGEWLAGTIKLVNHPKCGTLPDFGNFCFDWEKKDDPSQWYDRYKGVAELMPYAKAVSAKSENFDEQGNERSTDYSRMMRIVVEAGYRGYVGIEYEGKGLSEREGILATKRLLERVRAELA
jgi:sugar phosphate isomerase/epimerase